MEGLNFCRTGWLSYESTFVRKIEVLGFKLKQADEEKAEEFSRGKNDSKGDFLLHHKISYMTNSTLKLKQVKGQLISKGPKNQRNFLRISALASKKRSNKKVPD